MLADIPGRIEHRSEAQILNVVFVHPHGQFVAPKRPGPPTKARSGSDS